MRPGKHERHQIILNSAFNYSEALFYQNPFTVQTSPDSPSLQLIPYSNLVKQLSLTKKGTTIVDIKPPVIAVFVPSIKHFKTPSYISRILLKLIADHIRIILARMLKRGEERTVGLECEVTLLGCSTILHRSDIISV